MFDAEFTHEGDLCTFEVLLARWGCGDAALRRIADLVHYVDLRDGKFGREETDGFTALITGICLQHRDDGARLDAGFGAARRAPPGVPAARPEVALPASARRSPIS